MRFRSAGARLGLPRRENASRSETMRPTRPVSVVSLPEVLAEFLDAPRGDAVVLQHALHEHGEVEHAGDGVIDLVSHAGGELAEGGQPVVLQELLSGRP